MIIPDVTVLIEIVIFLDDWLIYWYFHFRDDGNSTIGQYVYVYVLTQTYLTLCEVEVFGLRKSNILI